MLLNFRCRRCRRPLSIEADQKGNSITCPRCQCEMVVPAASEPNVPPGQVIQGIYALQEDPQTEAKHSPEAPDQQIRNMTWQDLIPSGSQLTEKAHKKPRGPHLPKKSKSRADGLWPRSLAAGGGILLLVAAVGAYWIRPASNPSSTPLDEAPSTLASVPAVFLPLAPPPPADEAVKAPEPAAASPPAASVVVRAGSLSPSLSSVEPKPPAAAFMPPAPAADAKPRSESSRVALKRRQTRSEDELRRELHRAPEVPSFTFEQVSRLMMTHGAHFQVSGGLDYEPRALLEARPDLKSLPVRHGLASQLDPDAAASLEAFARRLHYYVDRVVPKEQDGNHTLPVLLHEFMRQEIRGKRPSWLRPQAVPALKQILSHEDKPIRWLLIQLLTEIPGPAASVALAQRAVFDLSPELRELAIDALKSRPAQEYRLTLVNALRYPWTPAADHAAEALVALKDQTAVANLVALLKMPDPGQPFQALQNQTFVREMVRINHQANCLMCHAPAANKQDPVVAAVPGFFTSAVGFSANSYGPTRAKVYSSPVWIRADITYLRQDFSVHIPCSSATSSPSQDQRFDFIVRARKCTHTEKEEAQTKSPTATYPQREAVLWALRDLTGKDAGGKTEDWVQLFPRAEMDTEAAQLTARLVKAKGPKQAQLLEKFKNHEGVIYTQALAGAIPRLKGKLQQQARQSLAERLSRMTVDTLRGRLKDEDLEIRRAAAVACSLKGKDDLVPDLVELLEDSEEAVTEAAQDALQRLTGRDIGAGG
jgi:HEAT repeat protein